MEVRKLTSTAVLGRKKHFVEEQFWDDTKDGPYDKSKVTEEVFFGKRRKGIWVYTGREGVWEGLSEEKLSIDDVHMEGPGSGG